ncbi:signal peptidase II [Cohnella nanjingensis]|uniref:Lipoprotein signal peptidase n=1 Tax=Cohnella nanjingensis TaxID=1387779 RepID=A0A7X0RVL5_9BACL|nr:signal peptidase II [Cohnella nanjingensis]MBB6674420.1 signal peptidase II [Cohnella nanjingensis]
MLLYIVTLLVVAVDQFSKIWIRAQLPLGDTIEVWPGVLRFTHIVNTGAAGSSFEGYGRLFVPVAIAVVIWVLYAKRKGQLEGAWLQTGAAFFVGGAVGNAIDRVLFNQVTDFIAWSGGRGIMNFADLAINIGVLLGIAGLLFARRRRAASAGL